MKAQYLLFALLAIAMLSSCQPGKNEATSLSISTQADPGLEYEHLRLYPIVAEADFLQQNPAAGEMLNLPEALAQPRFRITEYQPFGRFSDASAVNNLTVQNKTESAVFLMAGDILQGGNQDRVIAQDAIIAARSIVNIPVFCVEPGRWSPRHDATEESPEKARHIYAFTGYYHVASGSVRRAAAQSKNQQEVWDQVARVTAAHEASTPTGAYAALEQSSKFTAARDAYLRFFAGKFAERPAIVGLIAVSGKQVIGADIFAHPALFQKQFPALLHSYATDAITSGGPVQLEAPQIAAYARKMLSRAQAALDGSEGASRVHFSDL